MEIWIEWADRKYGPYTSAEDALKDGFHLPPESLPVHSGTTDTPERRGNQHISGWKASSHGEERSLATK